MSNSDTDNKKIVEGYYWMSDATEPVIVNQVDSPEDWLNKLDPTENPFVIEAQLFDGINKKSYSVKYVDGHYVVKSYKVEETVKDVKADYITLKRFVPNRMSKHRLLFLQYWREQEDPLCANMPVLQPAEMVFVGFEEK